MEEEKKPEEGTEEKKPKDTIQIRDVTDAGSNDKALRFTKRFWMDWESEDGKQSGEFTIKRPTLGEQARIGTLAAEYREDKSPQSLDRATFALHNWMATCAVVVTKAPTWFDPVNMFDSEPLLRVYEEARAFFESFRKKRVE